ncbi:MAG: IS4 family transposase [Polyangiaceae bacterium]|nr:IS4 family transposase [Polyangiaceae bacterium]
MTALQLPVEVVVDLAKEFASPNLRDGEALYRFFKNRRVSMEALLGPHHKRTLARMAEQPLCLVLHDTTEVAFPGVSEGVGLGPLRDSEDKGFLLHLSLAVCADGLHLPLGVLAASTLVRPNHKGRGRNKHLSGGELSKKKNKESERWPQQVALCRNAIGSCANVIHVADREGDAYPFLAEMLSSRDRFVVRLARDRHVFEDEWDDEGLSISETWLDTVIKTTLDVPVAGRGKDKVTVRGRPRQPEREATVSVGARRLELRRPRYYGAASGLPERLEVNVVFAVELDPPEGCNPLSWLLLTSEPVETAEQQLAVLGWYKARWLLEEFNKALKTGCAYESRQLEGYHGLRNALGLFLPIAWQLLRLKVQARQEPQAPATDVLSQEQLDVLQQTSRQGLPEQPTVSEALGAIAKLGGHLKRNGAFGWQVLWRGMRRLDDLVAGWKAAKFAMQTMAHTSKKSLRDV